MCPVSRVDYNLQKCYYFLINIALVVRVVNSARLNTLWTLSYFFFFYPTFVDFYKLCPIVVEMYSVRYLFIFFAISTFVYYSKGVVLYVYEGLPAVT